MSILYSPKTGVKEVSFHNGQQAVSTLISDTAARTFGKPFLIASNAWSGNSRPPLIGVSWTTPTTDTHETATRIRADFPPILETEKAPGPIIADGKIIIQNKHKTNTSIIEGLRIYNGNPSDLETVWLLEPLEPAFWIGPGQYMEIDLRGIIRPSKNHGLSIESKNQVILCVDCAGYSGGTPVIEYVHVIGQPILWWDDSTSTRLDVPNSHSNINTDWYNSYIKNLYTINKEFHCQNVGTLGAIACNDTDGSKLGFAISPASSTRAYNMFEPYTMSDDNTRRTSSLWVPAVGMGTTNVDGWTNYRLFLSWTNVVDKTGVILSYPFVIFREGPGPGQVFNLATHAMSDGTPTTVKRTIDISLLGGPVSGFAVLPRVKTNKNCNIWSSNFSCQIIPVS